MKKIKKILIISTSLILLIMMIAGGIVSSFFALGDSKGGTKTDISIENSSLTSEQLKFVSEILNGAIETYTNYNILPSVTIAQAILESGWGKSELAIRGNNLFGIKADVSWKGDTISMLTTEYVSGNSIVVSALWRAYKTKYDSIIDHGKFLNENSIYVQAGVFSAANYKDQITAIWKAGYATAPDYVNKICNIIETYNFNIYDGDNLTVNDNVINNAITTGKGLIGKSTYVFGGGRTDNDIARGRFDCSSFIYYIFASNGVKLGYRTNVSTYTLIDLGLPVEKNDLQAGDLLFFNTEGVNTHVGIYIGNGQFMHCSSSAGVIISNFSGYYENVFYKARRLKV